MRARLHVQERLAAEARLSRNPVPLELVEPAEPTTRAIVALQRSAGNAAVAQLVARAPTERSAIRMPPLDVKGRPPTAVDPQFAPTQDELEEAAAAMNTTPDDPRVETAVVQAKLKAFMRGQAEKSRAAKSAEEQVKPTPSADPTDPHQWKQGPGESIEQFLERQRKGLLKKELERTGLTEEQLRDQVTRKGTRSEIRVSLGSGIVGVSVTEAIPRPDGGIVVISTTEIHRKGRIERTSVATDFGRDEQAVVKSEVVDGEEHVLLQRGNPKLFQRPPAEPPKRTEPKRGTPHTKWTQLPDGRVRVDYIDEYGAVIPGRSYVTDLFQSPQQRRGQ
jgi:hypothetical protein